MPYRAEEWIGREAVRDLRLTEEMLTQFASVSGDFSPIHMDDGFARDQGFPGRIAHGVLLASFVSGVLGMELPGAAGILHEVNLSFRNACRPGDSISIKVSVSEFFESVQVMVLRVVILRSDGLKLVTGTVRSGLREHNG